MPAKPSGEVKTRQVRIRQKNGDIYVFERQVLYDPVKKYEKTVQSKLLGKIPAGEDTLVPTRPKRANGSAEQEKSGILTAQRTHIGMMTILDHIGKVSGIDDALYSLTDLGTAQKIISIARYFVATNGQTLPALESWQILHPTPYKYDITEDVYHDLFQKIAWDESIQQNYFKARCSMLSESDAIAYDSTTISTYSQNLKEARYGHNKAGDGLEVIKYVTLYSIESRQPVAFTKQAGNIPDVISVANALKELNVLGMSVSEIVMDNGFYSEENLSLMFQNHCNFITLAENNIKWIRQVIDEHYDEFNSASSLCQYDNSLYAVTAGVMHEFQRKRKNANHKTGAGRGDVEVFKRRLYLHIYFNREKQARERTVFDQNLAEAISLLNQGLLLDELPAYLQKTAGKYLIIQRRGKKTTVTCNKEACDRAYRYHGFFVLVARIEKDNAECLRKYRTRERIERFYIDEKECVDGTRTRVWDDDILRGRMFVQFVALGYHEFFGEMIRRMKEEIDSRLRSGTLSSKEQELEKKLKTWLNKTSLFCQLQWFEPMEQVVVADQMHTKRWTSEITARDRLYLSLLGIESLD